MYNPKVSIIIPAFNEENYISKCIEACLSQDYNNYEIIVIDNASTDKTFETSSKYKIKVIKENRKGTLWARQCGLENSDGELIATIDADCIPVKGWLSSGVKHFKDEKVSGLSGPYLYFDAPFFEKNLILICMKYVYSTVNFLQRKTGNGGITIGGNTMLRKDLFIKAGGYTTSIVFWGDDTDTAIKLSRVGKIIYDRNFIMNTSYRRFKNEGFMKLTLKYQFHFFNEIFQKTIRR
jgi:cellulose synthase/poly-beta-1,6-N-acetylglucosamine synthase-like glycosyltransferase